MSIVDSNKLRIKGLVDLLPGVHLRQLQRILGISFNSTRYHVNSLSETGEILRQDEGRYARLYPSITNESDRTLYSIMRNKASRKMLQALASGKGLTNKQLVEKTGLAKSTVSEHLQTFLLEHIVRISLSEQGRVSYVLRERDRISRLVSDADRTKIMVAADRFVELWDF